MVPSRQDLQATASIQNIPLPAFKTSPFLWTCKTLWVRRGVLPDRDGEMPSSLNTDINPIIKQMEMQS